MKGVHTMNLNNARRAPIVAPLVLQGSLLAGAAIVVSSASKAADALQSPADITVDTARASALFEEMGRVFTHPRCMNGYLRDDIPGQGDAMAKHQPPAVRGAGELEAPGMRCSTCHGADNVAFATAESGSIPGPEVRLLAPGSMGRIELSVAEICEQVKDPERNGDRTLEELLEHNAHDVLVGWGWEPGDGRQPAPGTQAEFGALTEAWIEAGAHCPDT